MTSETDVAEAREALVAAQHRLAMAQRRGPRVGGIERALSGVLQENHISVRLARMFDIEDDRR